jgi:RNA polymerase-binding transcription factor DksA
MTHTERSPFTPAELAQWRARLLALRATLREEATLVASSAAADASGDDAGQMDTDHSPDAALGAARSDIELIRDIDLALERIDTGKPAPFGICVRTRRRIERARLDLVPWTPLCAAAARAGAG